MSTPDVASGRDLPEEYEHTGFRLSWGAIVAGLVVAVMLQVIFSLLGVAIGLSGWSPDEGVPIFNTGAAVWAGVSALIALGVGGLVTGRLAGVLTTTDGVLHGVVMWGLTTLLGFWLVLNGAGFLLGSVSSVLGETISTVASSTIQGAVQAGGAAGSIDFAALEDEVRDILRETGDPALNPDSLAAIADTAGERMMQDTTDIEDVVAGVIDRIERRAGEVDRDDVINVVVARTDLSRAEAERVADRVESAATRLLTQVSAEMDTLGARAESELRQGSRTAADWGSTGAWWMLLIMIVSAGAAAGGAAVTARS